MGKNIVICCDGTGNEHSESNTNVGYFFEAIDRDSTNQAVFYDAGVGTFGPFGWRLGKWIGQKLGAAFGYGVKRNIEEAYRFLMDHYDAGDRVFILGFSRGAFTARSLAAMLDKCGLLYPNHHNLILYVSQKYFGNAPAAEVTEFKRVFCRPCNPHFLGVWDTVGSLGVLLSLRQFHNMKLSSSVTNAYHAVSIDEKRRMFPPALWDENDLEDGQNVHQVWFAGVHSDAGGGYPERGLGDITLQWMLEHAAEHGLELNEDAFDSLNPDPQGHIHKSFTWKWWLLGTHTREVPSDANIHTSVWDRLKSEIGYQPNNLPPRANN